MKLWLHNGWVDFLVPQLYWPIEPAKLSFRTLYGWWWTENPQRRPIYAGMAIDRVGKDRDAGEVLKQIRITRQDGPVAGHVHWNWKSLLADKDDLLAKLRSEVYTSTALPPSTGGGLQVNVPPLRAEVVAGSVNWSLVNPAELGEARWVLAQFFDGKSWRMGPLRRVSEGRVMIPAGTAAVALRTIGPSGGAGIPVVLPVAR